MLIRSTSQVCFVMWRNGLTLEIVYGDALAQEKPENDTTLDERPRPSHGVWLMGESVLFEVKAGLA